MPLGYLLVQSSTTGTAGVKEQFLEEFLSHFRSVWSVKAIITLTDKDWSEIKAFMAVYPEAKHQLCFWHVLRAIKKRLAILRRMPAHYDANSAHSEFPWINPKFVSVGQSQDAAMVSFIRGLIEGKNLNKKLCRTHMWLQQLFLI
jgi:hypothetical protein